jgi:transposase-like protein
VIRLWRNASEGLFLFVDYDVEIKRVLCSANAIESLNTRYRRAVRARGHFPTEQAALNSWIWSPGVWTRPALGKPGGRSGESPR